MRDEIEMRPEEAKAGKEPTVGCGGKEEQQSSVLGNSKFNMVMWCRSFNGLERSERCVGGRS
jgi:hypothetical protein